jgi:alpha-tubulin suppressor-like RCC1 family protein
MSGQRSSNSEGTAESVAAGCSLREGPPHRYHHQPVLSTADGTTKTTTRRQRPLDLVLDGLAVFTWGRGEDGQLGLGDTADQDEPTYVRAVLR